MIGPAGGAVASVSPPIRPGLRLLSGPGLFYEDGAASPS